MLLILLTVVFTVMRVIPGDPVAALFAGRASPGVVARTRSQLGRDQPIWQQYINYVGQIFTGNLGMSIGESCHGKSVLTAMLDKSPATVELAIGALSVASSVGITSGS